jgi:endogenous inhibitor of DNA gyrase (YacG/DUF329 family)
MTETTVKCPICERLVAWRSNNPYRPFCSERCQLIDLGEWVSGGRSIDSDADYDDITSEDLSDNT